MSKMINFNVLLSVNGKKQLVEAQANTEELRKKLDGAQKSVRGLAKAFVPLNQGIEYIRNLADSVRNLGESFRATAGQSRMITQLTGETGSGMRELRGEVSALADYFGKDFNDVLRSANALSKGFGISAKEAVGLLRDGLVSGADAGGDFLDTVREYPRYFKEAGLSAEDFIAISTNASRQGVYSDKGVDAIKEGNLRIREMTTATAAALEGIGISSEGVLEGLRSGSLTTFEVMQQVASRLRELPPSASEVGAALADIFGGPGEDAGQEYIKSLADVRLSMDEVKAASGGLAEQQEAAVRAQEKLNFSLQDYIDLAGLYAQVKPFVGFASEVGTAVMGVNGLVTAMKSLNVQAVVARARVVRAVAGMAGMARTTVAATRNFVLYGGAARGAAAGSALLGGAARGAAAGVGMLGVALRALLVSTGIGVALMALGAAVSAFTDDTEEAAQAAESVADRYDSVKESMAGVRAQMESDLATLKNWTGSKEEEAALVDRLNNRYGETMGYFASVADWYKALTENSAAWCRQMENEARMRKLADEAAEIQQNIHDIRYNDDGTTRLYSTKRNTRYKAGAKAGAANWATPGAMASSVEFEEIVGSSDVEKANAKLRGLWSSLAGVRKQMDALAKETVEYAVKGSSERPKAYDPTGTNTQVTAQAPAALGSIDWYEGAIRGLQEQISATADMGLARELQNRVEMLQSALGDLKIRIGIDKPEETAAAARELTQRIGDDFAAWKEEHPLQPLDMEDDEDRLAGMRKGLDKVGKTAQATGQMFGALGEAFEQPAFNIMGTIAQAVATLALTFANSLKGEPSVWTWIAGAAAGTATLISTIASIRQATAFAEGGIVSGPTYALVGEYAGARNNPEVIAPLNKLRSLIEPQRGFEAGQVRFEIEGRTLAGLLEKVNRLDSRR